MKLHPFAHLLPERRGGWCRLLAAVGFSWGRHGAPQESGRLGLWLGESAYPARRTRETDGTIRTHWRCSGIWISMDVGKRTHTLYLHRHGRLRNRARLTRTPIPE